MKKIKEPAVANAFYSGNAKKLSEQIDTFAKESKNTYTYKTRAVIVPHAGLVYSGRLAYEGISQLSKDIKNLFIFAPAHRVGFLGLALSSYDEWKTPLGHIEVNQEINQELIDNFDLDIFDDAHREEHSIEIELPIIQKVFDDVKIIPVLVGKENPQKITQIIEKYYPNEENGFIISSDLSHFLTNEKAKELDDRTAQMIELGVVNEFKSEQACGAISIVGLTEFANKNDFSLIRIDMINSSDTTGDKSNVVGYGCWFLYEGEKNQFIKDNYSQMLLDMCRGVLKAAFDNSFQPPICPAVLKEWGATFVTLEKNHNLRGCIGSIIPHQPLITDLIQNVQNSAFKDSRFLPVQKSEIKDLTINISILSSAKRISFIGEEDLLDKIVPYVDGIIIRDGNYQAVYLPSVWSQLPDKRMFLKSLKVKAGMSPNHFSETFEAYRFKTVYIEENG